MFIELLMAGRDSATEFFIITTLTIKKTFKIVKSWQETITYIIYRIFFWLFFFLADAKLELLIKLDKYFINCGLSNAVVKMNSWGKSPRVASVVVHV